MVCDTSRSETRRVGSGTPRGGRFGVGDGVETTPHSLWKQVERPSECGTFSGYARAVNEGDIDEVNNSAETS